MNQRYIGVNIQCNIVEMQCNESRKGPSKSGGIIKHQAVNNVAVRAIYHSRWSCYPKKIKYSKNCPKPEQWKLFPNQLNKNDKRCEKISDVP
jgi:hypothetical protein